MTATATDNAGQPKGTASKLAALAGLILAVLALFFAPASARELLVWLHRSDFVPDELELEYFIADESTVGGHIVSTGERCVRDAGTIGLDSKKLRELDRGKNFEGRREPVWYFPKQGVWRWVDFLTAFRVRWRPPAEPAPEFGIGIPAINALLLFGAIGLIRRGFRKSGRGGH